MSKQEEFQTTTPAPFSVGDSIEYIDSVETNPVARTVVAMIHFEGEWQAVYTSGEFRDLSAARAHWFRLAE